jgi:cation transport ATPase
MAEKKRTSDSSEDKVLDDMTNDFDDVFSEIKDKNDVESKKNQLEEESAIRGIFGRIKKKNSNQKNSLSETEKKTSSMNLSDSQEILDLSKEVTGSAKEEAVVVVKAEEESNGVTTITMKIPKLTDEKLAEIIAEQKQADMTKKKVEDKPKEDVQTEKKSSETKNQDLNSEVDDIANTQKQAEHKIESKEKENKISDDFSQEADEKPSFKSKFSKFLSTAKEKALYYLGFEDDEEYDDDVIFSTSSGVERLKNANPLDFDEEYKENIVYQAPDGEKKDNKPDLLKIAAQNTTINTDFNLTEDKSKETKIESEEKPVETETKSEVEEKPVETETKSEVEEKPVETETKSEVEEKPVETETKSEVEEKPVETETKSEVEEKPVETETKSKIDKKPITAEIKSDTKVYKKKTDDELTFDEILAEEKRNRISIDIALDDDESNEDISNSPLSDQLDFSILSEQIAGDALREPRRSKKPKTEKPIKSEETAKSVEVETKEETKEETKKETKKETKEETTKPAEIEIKSAEDDINFESVAKQIMADTKVEKTVSKPIQSEVKNDDFDFDSPFIQIIDMPVKKHIEEKAEPVKQAVAEEKTEPVKQAVAEEKTEPVEQAVVEEKTEPVEQAVAEEKTEPVKQAVAEEKTEPVKQAVVEEKTEPVKQAVVEEKTEPVEQAVAEEKTEPVKQAVAEEKTEPVEQAVAKEKTEPVKQAVAEEKTEPVKQAVAEEKIEPVKQVVVEEKTEPVEQAVAKEKTEDSENPFVRIVDRVKPKQKSSEPVVPQKQFNPIIIEDEKLIQEFKLDFAKDNIPKTLLTYSRPSEKNNFVVMAGKFTKTVRSEYRAYKYKPKSPEPPTPPDDKQNPPRSEQSKQLEQKKKNDESVKTSVFGEFSFKKLKKNPEPEQKAQPQQEQKHTSVVKPVHKQEVQQTKAEETPKVKIPKPKMPTVPPAVKMAVPSFIRKKQRPEIMPDIKEKKEAVQPEPEKTTKPKTEKKKNNKASEAKKAIKKKTQMLKLFSDDEDFDIDDIDFNGENREIEEYSSKNDEREIRSEINNNYRKLTFRSIIVAIGLVFSITLDILVGVISETFMSMPFGWLLVAFLNAIILCVCVVACYVPIINGLIPLRHFKANSDTSLAVASFAGILQAFVSFFSPQSFINGYLHYYTTLVILGLLLNCIGRMLIITRVHDNFKFIMKNPELYAGKIYTDERNAKRMFMGAPLNKPLIAYRKKTKFLSNFLQLSYAPDPSENIASKIAPITSVVAIVAALLYAFIGGGVAEGASAFVLFAIILTPVCQLVAVNLPIKKLCSAVVKKGSMVTSYESVKQFCDTNAIIVDANDLYPSGTVTMSGIKTFSGSKVDDAIRGAAAVMFAVKAPMSSMFDNIIKSKRDTLPHVESVIYEDGLGLVGWVAGQRILLGNRRLLEAHGIKVPSVEYEKKYTDKSKQAVYLSLGGELVAMFIVTYKGSSYIAEELRNLEQNGVTILVRTIDSNITQDRIAEDFGVFYRSVKILPTGLGNITKEMTDTPDEETRAYIATKGGIQSFARAISGCIRIKSNVTLSIFLQMAGIILGFVLVGVITFISGIARLNILELLIMYVFCIIVGIVAPTIRKP